MLPGPEPVPSSPAEDWLALKDAVQRFEHAWREGSRPGIDDYLPIGNPLRAQCAIAEPLQRRDRAVAIALVLPEAIAIRDWLGQGLTSPRDHFDLTLACVEESPIEIEGQDLARAHGGSKTCSA